MSATPALLETCSPHLITLSARTSTLGGIVRPICFAAFRLMMNSNFVGCSTGISAGLAPWRILAVPTGTWTFARLCITLQYKRRMKYGTSINHAIVGGIGGEARALGQTPKTKALGSSATSLGILPGGGSGGASDRAWSRSSR